LTVAIQLPQLKSEYIAEGGVYCSERPLAVGINGLIQLDDGRRIG
jgi:hypothetical protein